MKIRITMEFKGNEVEDVKRVCDIIRTELSDRIINFPLLEVITEEAEGEQADENKV